MQLSKKTSVILIIVILILAVAAVVSINSSGKNWLSQKSGIGGINKEKIDETPKVGIVYNIEERAVTQEDANIQYALTSNENLQDARVEIPGASPISQENVVLTYEGEVADNGAEPGSALAPKPTLNISRSDIVSGSLIMEIGANGFNPAEITASAGEPATIALISADSQPHVLRFESPVLKAISFAVMPEEIRAITFNAPASGSYPFFCEVPGHRDSGEAGVLIVR